MSERFFEENKKYETPENNVKLAALNAMRFMMLMQIGKGASYPCLDLDDVNIILTVAGLPVIVPGEVNKKGVEVIL